MNIRPPPGVFAAPFGAKSTYELDWTSYSYSFSRPMPIQTEMSYHAWFEHFKEQLQGLTESFEQSGSPLSLLGFALKEKSLSSEVYFKWAMAHYNFPKLRSS